MSFSAVYFKTLVLLYVCRWPWERPQSPDWGQSPDRTGVGVGVWRAEMAVSSHCKGDAFPLATLSLARLQVDPIGHQPDWLQRRLESGESDTLSHGMEAADQTPPPCLSSSSRCNIGYQLDWPSSTLLLLESYYFQQQNGNWHIWPGYSWQLIGLSRAF